MMVLQPGWYWWLVFPQDAKAWSDFTKANSVAAKGPLRVRKVFRGQHEQNEIPVFEVVGTPLAWTFSTPASKAKKKDKTELDDLIGGPNPSPSLIAAVEDIAGKPIALVKQGNDALKLVAIGAGAILLFNLFRNTAPDRERVVYVGPDGEELAEEAAE